MNQGGLKIQGDVGQFISVGMGSVVNLYVARPTGTDIASLNRLVHMLLRKGELAGMRRMLENISYTLYGSRYFKSLTLEQLITLHAIADEIVEVLYRSRGRYTVPTHCICASATL